MQNLIVRLIQLSLTFVCTDFYFSCSYTYVVKPQSINQSISEFIASNRYLTVVLQRPIKNFPLSCPPHRQPILSLNHNTLFVQLPLSQPERTLEAHDGYGQGGGRHGGVSSEGNGSGTASKYQSLEVCISIHNSA